ncbi:hypothetical protein Leryth_003156 [Lithospermum erythrorhizon]|nr:hypothetical protein Leryth_003156 [Lithospermum erythrorhizon]
MHCNACERSVAKIICKMKGVDTFMTDMPNNKVVVTGRINYQKLWKKLRKKQGKKVEMVIKKDEENDQPKGESGRANTLVNQLYFINILEKMRFSQCLVTKMQMLVV